MSIFIMPEGTKASDVVMFLQACHRQIDTLTAQRDRLAGLLEDALNADLNSGEGLVLDHDKITAALAELEKNP